MEALFRRRCSTNPVDERDDALYALGANLQLSGCPRPRRGQVVFLCGRYQRLTRGDTTMALAGWNAAAKGAGIPPINQGAVSPAAKCSGGEDDHRGSGRVSPDSVADAIANWDGSVTPYSWELSPKIRNCSPELQWEIGYEDALEGEQPVPLPSFDYLQGFNCGLQARFHILELRLDNALANLRPDDEF